MSTDCHGCGRDIEGDATVAFFVNEPNHVYCPECLPIPPAKLEVRK